MAKSKTKLVSRFPQAVKGGHEAITAAVKEALVTGVEEGQRRLDQARSRRGYDLDPFVVHQKHFRRADGELEGGMVFIHSDQWYYRFFETGSVYIPATPFMRPANRKMRKEFLERMEDDFEGFVSRRTKLSGRGSVTRNTIG